MMFCSNCGTQIPDTSKFCANCGTPVTAVAQGGTPAPPPQSPLQQEILGSWELVGSSGLGLFGPLISALVKRVQFFPDGTWQNPAVLGGMGGSYSFIRPDEMRLQSPQNVGVYRVKISGDAMTWNRDTQQLAFRRENSTTVSAGSQPVLGGIGTAVDIRGGKLMVVSHLKGSAGEKAGLLPNDVILQVDNSVVRGMNVTQAIALIRGPQGTSVKLLIQRAKQTPFEITIIRE